MGTIISFLMMALLQAPVLQGNAIITGIVRTGDGKPAVGIRVGVMVPQPGDVVNSSALVSLAQTDGSGRYRLEAVPPGRYYIVAGRVDAPTYYPGVQNAQSARPIVVTNAAIQGVDFTVSEDSASKPPSPYDLPPQVPLTVRLRLDESSSGAKVPERFSLITRVQIANGTVINSVSRIAPVTLDAKLPFSSWIGKASISVGGLPAGYTVRSMTVGTIDLLKERLDIPTASSAVPEIIITLSASPIH